jgi:hypothetical protein
MAVKNRLDHQKNKSKSQPAHKEGDEMVASKKIDNVLVISRNSINVLWQNRKLFSGIMLIYALLYIFFVRGLANLPSSSSLISGSGKLFSGFSIFSLIFVASSSSNSNPSGSMLQSLLLIIISLVLIWTLRHIYKGKKVTIRDGYYKALYPLIPFILILLFIGLELLPLIIGSTLYSIIVTQGIAINVVEKGASIAILVGLIILSLYFLSSSIFALYIVTLDDMTPVKALRSAKQLVKGRRAVVLRKILFMPLALIISTSIIVLPFILIYPPLAAWIIFLLTVIVIAVAHSYLYNLYRELIK